MIITQWWGHSLSVTLLLPEVVSHNLVKFPNVILKNAKKQVHVHVGPHESATVGREFIWTC